MTAEKRLIFIIIIIFSFFLPFFFLSFFYFPPLPLPFRFLFSSVSRLPAELVSSPVICFRWASWANPRQIFFSFPFYLN